LTKKGETWKKRGEIIMATFGTKFDMDNMGNNGGKKKVNFEPEVGEKKTNKPDTTKKNKQVLKFATPANPTITTNSNIVKSDMQSKTVGELAKEWTNILNKQTNKFQKSCEKVREWDTFLLQMRYDLNIFSKHTSKQIDELRDLLNNLETMKKEHKYISDELDKTFENVKEKIQDVTGGNETAADKERNKNYNLAEDVNREVMVLTNQLQHVVKTLNQVQEKRFGNGYKGMSQIEQIEQIVDKHLRTLEQIDQKTDQIAQSLGATQQINYQALQMRR
jgi:hypothetical protein